MRFVRRLFEHQTVSAWIDDQCTLAVAPHPGKCIKDITLKRFCPLDNLCLKSMLADVTLVRAINDAIVLEAAS